MLITRSLFGVYFYVISKAYKGVTVVILDASVDYASRMRHLMDKLGIRVLDWWISGRGWEKKWNNLKPDFSIVDNQMPHRDGLRIVQRMRAYKPEALIMFTHSYQGLIANAIEFNALKAGAATAMEKPFSDEQFLLRVENILSLFPPRKRLQMKKSMSHEEIQAMKSVSDKRETKS